MRAGITTSLVAACMALGVAGGIFFKASEAGADPPSCTLTQWQYYKCVSGTCTHAEQYCWCQTTDPNKDKVIWSVCSNGNPFCTVQGTSCKIAYCGDTLCDDPPG